MQGVADKTREPAAPSDRFVIAGYLPGFILVTSLFFLWALASSFNDILIRQFQKALALDRAEAGLIQLMFYLGYFFMALPAGLVIRRWGYRAGILVGLGLYAAGALLFWPAAEVRLYWPFLGALFVLASGAAFLETAANPYIVAFGDSRRAAQRLNLAQAFNGVGAVVAPIIGGLFIFSGVEHGAAALTAMTPAQLDAYHASEAHMVQKPYLALAGVVLLIAVATAIVRLPKVSAPAAAGERTGLGSLLLDRPLMAAVLAQFFYVAAQVGVWSFFVDFTKDMMPATPEKVAAYMLSASLALFMIGRFAGAALMHRIAAPKLLFLFAAANVALCAVAGITSGAVAVAALGLTSFFMSIQFPTIFALGVEGQGKRTSIASSLIIMAIIGGACAPPLMGLISRGAGGLRLAMVVPLVCFLFVALFARTRTKSAAADLSTAPIAP